MARIRERWKDIEGFEGYQVSNLGRVRSCVNNRHGLCDKYHLLVPCRNKLGYCSVNLGRNKRRSIHRLVAEAFIPNKHNYPLVRHLDDNPSNNVVDNLAWGTQIDNMQDCVKHGRLVGDTSYAIKSKEKRIIATKKDGSETRMFKSINDAARVLNVWPQHVSNVAMGRISQTGGWIFKYADEEEMIYG